jgi:hypothetical protein
MDVFLTLTSVAFRRPETSARKCAEEGTSLYGSGAETLPFMSVIKFVASGDIHKMHFPNLVMSTETSEQVTKEEQHILRK